MTVNMVSEDLTTENLTTANMINATIDILGRVYAIRCQEGELQHLEEAARFLNEQMMSMKAQGKTANMERIAVIAALNIAHQLLSIQQQKKTVITKINDRLSSLQSKMELALNQELVPFSV